MPRTSVATDDFEAAGNVVDSFPGTGDWTDLDNNNGQIRVVAGKGVQNAFNANSTMRRAAGVYSADQYAKGQLNGIVADANQKIGVTVRNSADTATSGGQDCYAFYLEETNPVTLAVAKMTNNTLAAPLASTQAVAVANDDTLSVEVTGTGATVTLNCYLNDVIIAALANVQDSSSPITAAGRPGVIGFGLGGTLYLDNWEGGDVTASSDPEGRLVGGKLLGGGVLIGGRLVR
jgi:hypothetical protein